jgi:hypothetical protein
MYLTTSVQPYFLNLHSVLISASICSTGRHRMSPMGSSQHQHVPMRAQHLAQAA